MKSLRIVDRRVIKTAETCLFFDDTLVDYCPKISVDYLTKANLELVWEEVKQSPIRITYPEFDQYRLRVDEEDDYKFAFVASNKYGVLGFTLFSDCGEVVFINHLYVKPQFRFQGIGSLLMKSINDHTAGQELSYIDTSSTYMPWMDFLGSKQKIDLAHRLGSFYR